MSSGGMTPLTTSQFSVVCACCATNRIVNKQLAIVGFWGFIGMHRCYMLLHNKVIWHYQWIKSSVDWLSPIKLRKLTIASCMLTILLMAKLCGIGSTRPSEHAPTTCLIDLFVGHFQHLLLCEQLWMIFLQALHAHQTLLSSLQMLLDLHKKRASAS